MVSARPPNIGSQRTPLARPVTWRFFINAVACRRVSRSTCLPAAPLKPGVGRSLNPSVFRACAWHAASAAVWAGSRRDSVGGFWKAAAGGRHRVRRAAGRTRYACHTRRAYRPHVRWAPARRPATHVAAQPRSQQTPLARPITWAFCTPVSCAVARLAPSLLPAALLKRVVGRSLSLSVVRPCAWRAARAGAWGPDRAAVAWGAHERCVGRAPSFAWGAAGRTRYACRYRRAHARMCGGRPPAAPLPNQPPNIARSGRHWRGPEPGCVFQRRRVPSRASVEKSCQRRR